MIDVSLGEEIYQITGELMEEGHKPFAVAAIYAMVAMQIYRTVLSDEEYNSMIDFISNNRDKINKLGNAGDFMVFNQSDLVH